MQKKDIIFKCYEFFLILSIFFRNFNSAVQMRNSFLSDGSNYCTVLFFLLTFISALLLIINYSMSISYYSIKSYMIILIILTYGLIFHDNTFILMALFGIISGLLAPDEIIKIFGISNGLVFIMIILCAFVGILPMHVTAIYAGVPVGDMLTLGFIHKNSTGYYFFMFISTWIYLNKLHPLFNILLLIFSILFCGYIIGDRTIALLFLLLLLLLIFRKKIRFSYFKFIYILPIFLVILSFYCTYHYGVSTWVNKFDDFLSSRIAIWNWDLTHYSISLFPQDITINNVYSMDGFYALGALIYGIIGFAIIIGLLVYLLYFLTHYMVVNQNLYDILLLIIILVLMGTVEQIPIISTNYLLPLAFSVIGLKKGRKKRCF